MCEGLLVLGYADGYVNELHRDRKTKSKGHAAFYQKRAAGVRAGNAKANALRQRCSCRI